MRTTAFGEPIIESLDDDLGLCEALQEAGDEIYAVISLDEGGSGLYEFEVMQNEDGEGVVSSEAIFSSSDAARSYLRGHVSDIQVR